MNGGTRILIYTKVNARRTEMVTMWVVYDYSHLHDYGYKRKRLKGKKEHDVEISTLLSILPTFEFSCESLKIVSPLSAESKTLKTKDMLYSVQEKLIKQLTRLKYNMRTTLTGREKSACIWLDKIADKIFRHDTSGAIEKLYENVNNIFTKTFVSRGYMADGKFYTPALHSSLMLRALGSRMTVYCFVRYGDIGTKVSFVTDNKEFITKEYVREMQYMNPDDKRLVRLYKRLKQVKYNPMFINTRYIRYTLKLNYELYLDILRLTDNGRYPYFRIEECPIVRQGKL